jgi:hypothetical protein
LVHEGVANEIAELSDEQWEFIKLQPIVGRNRANDRKQSTAFSMFLVAAQVSHQQLRQSALATRASSILRFSIFNRFCVVIHERILNFRS